MAVANKNNSIEEPKQQIRCEIAATIRPSIPRLGASEYTSLWLHVYPLTFNPAIELSDKLLARFNCHFEVRIKYATLLDCGQSMRCCHNVLDLKRMICQGCYGFMISNLPADR
jgi:hypothetical protein